MSHLEFEIAHHRERMFVDRNHVGYGYRLDYCELARSALADGEYYFFTCGCGEPGCAGIHEPTVVTSDADKIYWHIIEPEPEDWFTFRRANYVEAIREAMGAYLRLYSGKSAHRAFGRYRIFNRHTFEELHASLVAAGNKKPEME